jgi:predicted heme/steroid binding protein
MVKILTREQLEKLTTKRLLAYKNKLMDVHEGPNWDEGSYQGLNKTDEEWKSLYALVKEILAARKI